MITLIIVLVVWGLMMFLPPIKINAPWLFSRGLAISPFFFVRPQKNKKKEAETVKHELVHIKQQRDAWIFPFYIKYFYYQIKYGYSNNPYEVEAFKKQKE